MCNLYSVTTNQEAIRRLFVVAEDRAGNLPPLSAVFPDQTAPIVRAAPGGGRELVLARWGVPGPPQAGAQLVTNLRNAASPFWRRWLAPASRCLVPVNAFCEAQFYFSVVFFELGVELLVIGTAHTRDYTQSILTA
jgi:putative SOS response-associated peptidase YedK